ncbi:MAG: hypothetical protein ABIK15_03300 [Pseudomonadota bacterium]
MSPWLLVGEGIAVVPALIIIVIGGYEVGWEESLWGSIPIITLWTLFFFVGSIAIFISHHRSDSHDIV